MAFDVKSTFQLKNGDTAQFVDSIVVTDTGAPRLGKREMKVAKLMRAEKCSRRVSPGT